MADAQQQVGIVITGKDKSGPAFKSAANNAEQFKKKAAGLTDTVKAMPEQFGKAAGAMILFQNATSQMGGKVADATNKLTAVVGLIATGGPLGIAIAGITAAVLAFSAIWDTFTVSSRRAEERLEALREKLKGVKAETDNAWASVQSLNDQLQAMAENEDAGVLALQRKQFQLNYEIQLLEKAERKLERRVELGQELTDAQKTELRGIRENLGALRSQEKAIGSQILHEKELIDAKKDEAAASKAAADAEKKAQERALRAKQERLKQEQELLRFMAENEAAERAEAEKAEALREERRIEAVNRRLALEDRIYQDKLQKEQELIAAEEAAQQKRVAMANAIADIWGQAMQQAVTDSENAAKAILIAFISTVEKVIMAYAAEAAAAAFKANVGVAPVVGIAIATAAAGAAFGIVKGYVSKFNRGGLVRGGVPGMDSVNASLTPGEVVVPAPVVRDIVRGGDGTNGGGQTVVVNASANVSSLDPSSVRRADMQRLAVALGEEIAEQNARNKGL